MYAVVTRLAAALVLAPLVAACGSERGADDARVYRHAVDGTPRTLDPVSAATTYSSLVVVNLFDTLYRYKYLARPYELAPNLAVGLPSVSDDGLTYTIRLRDDARFIDDPAFGDDRGRGVTASDVVYSLKRHFDPAQRSRGAFLWAGRIAGLDAWGDAGADYDQPVAGLEAVDDHTLRIRLTEPYPLLPHTLTTGFSAVVPREAVERYGREFGVRPVGSGPFRLQSFDSTMARLARNPDFTRPPLDLAAEGFVADRHGGLGLERVDGGTYPFVDGIEIHFIEETAARWSAFAGGAVDNIVVPNERLDSVLATRDPITLRPEITERYHGFAALELGFVYTGLDMSDPRYGHHPEPERAAANRALRCAMRSAFDWQQRNETFYYGIGRVFPGVIPPAVPSFDPQRSRASVTTDLERGRRLLAEHGWNADNLPALTYGYVGSVAQRQIFAQFRDRMLALGFPPGKIVAEVFPTFGEFSRAIDERQLDVFFLSWLLDYPDAQNTLQLFYGPNATPGSNNFNYDNPEFDALYERAISMQPGPERTRLYRRMNGLVIDDCVAISGLSRNRVHLWNDDIAMLPDSEILAGFFLRFVDVEPAP
jgi:ABC-type transport system substrate-binding protein